MARQDGRRGGSSRIWLPLLAVALVVAAGAGVAVAAQDQFEPNERPETATSIDDGTYDGLEVSSDGSDYFEFDLAEGETLDVSVSFTHEEGDLDATVYNSDEREVAGSTSTTDNESFTYTADADETVHLRVYGYDYHSNSYSLTVSTDGGSGSSDGENATETADGDEASESIGGDTSSSDGDSGSSSDDDSDDGSPGFGILGALAVLAAVGIGSGVRRR